MTSTPAPSAEESIQRLIDDSIAPLTYTEACEVLYRQARDEASEFQMFFKFEAPEECRRLEAVRNDWRKRWLDAKHGMKGGWNGLEALVDLDTGGGVRVQVRALRSACA